MNLDEIEARANAATPGPWFVHESDRPGDYWTVSADPDWPFECEVFDDGSAGGEYGPACSIEDRDFLVAARTDVPALIARVRELEEEREQIRARLEEECERTRGLEHELANHGRIQMTQPTNKSTTFQINGFIRAPMTLVDYGLSMWVCAVCDKCAVFNRQAGKPNGWRTDRCPECQEAEE